METEKLAQAFKTVGAANSAPAEMIVALSLILTTYKETMARLTRELKAKIRRFVRMTAVGATDEACELVDAWRANVIELAGKISALECSLYLQQQCSKLKSA